MKEKINQKIKILDNDKTIFDLGYNFIIPIYQRGYEWEKEHIEKLIKDIIENNETSYYLGVLVISKNTKKQYEIIDGQQRLTTLYLILSWLGYEVSNLNFQCRESSSFTLKNIGVCIDCIKKRKKIPETFDEKICEKLSCIGDIFNEINLPRDYILSKFKKSVLIITELDLKNSDDLNHYFEVMNIRGEQLTQCNIIKSKLISYLDNRKTKEHNIYSEVWEACSDMNSYVQMNFKKQIRDQIFGNYWCEFHPFDYEELVNIINYNKELQPEKYNIKKIIKMDTLDIKQDENDIDTIYTINDNKLRFKSIIDFRYFLIHTLKVFSELYIKNKSDLNNILDDMLYETKIIQYFENVFEKNLSKFNLKNKEDATKKFLYLLLKNRFLFDNYIIKREYKGTDNSDNNWSLGKLKMINKSSYEVINVFSSNNYSNMMLQSAIRVTYTSPRVMHWITRLLLWLNLNYSDKISGFEFEEVTENYIKEEVKKTDFWKNKNYYMGVNTPHLIFNYLDYLLWKGDKNKYRNFVFEFRNSVEHFYPQNPDGFPEWKTEYKKNVFERDNFGNLCLITPSLNSKLSNDAPRAKKDNNISKINKISIKFRLMCELVNDKNDNNKWRNKLYKEHCKEMIDLLTKNIN